MKRDREASRHCALVAEERAKPRLSLLPRQACEETSRVIAFGVEKWAGLGSWRDVGWSVHLDAALRHVFQWLDGEELDRESGCSHLAHAISRLMFIENMRQLAHGWDDRWCTVAANGRGPGNLPCSCAGRGECRSCLLQKIERLEGENALLSGGSAPSGAGLVREAESVLAPLREVGQ